MENKQYDTEYFRSKGEKGGKTTKKRRGKDHYSEIGKAGAAKRWANKKKQI